MPAIDTSAENKIETKKKINWNDEGRMLFDAAAAAATELRLFTQSCTRYRWRRRHCVQRWPQRRYTVAVESGIERRSPSFSN